MQHRSLMVVLISTMLAACGGSSEPNTKENIKVIPTSNESTENEPTDNGSTDNGSTDNGSTDNGSTDNGSTDNGSTDNGSTDNGSTDNGSIGNVSTDNGSTDNGSTDNGSIGNVSTDNGSSDNGSIGNVSTDNGSSDNGSTDNGSTDNGSTDNGSTDNGSTDNGSTDNGSTDNGSTDNGSTDNGSTDNGSTDNGSTDNEATDNEATENEPTDDELSKNESTNNAPTLLNNTFTIGYHETLSIDVSDLASDSDGDPLTISDVQNANNLTVDPTDTSFTILPSSDNVGEQEVTFSISDGTEIISGSITVSITNATPVANDVAVTTNSNTVATIAPDVSDLEAGIVSIEFSDPNNGTIETVDGEVRYTPNIDYVGADELTYTVTDEVGESATAIISLDVLNQQPVAQDTAFDIDSNTNLVLELAGLYSDPESQNLTISYSAPSAGTIETNGDVSTYVPTQNYVGNDTVEYTVTDTHNAQATGTISITVNNQPPVAVDDEYRTVMNSPVALSLLPNDTDPEMQALSYVSSHTSEYGRVEVLNGQLTYTPVTGFFGQDSFTYTIEDTYGATASAEVIVHVGAVEFHIDDLATNSFAPGIVINGRNTGRTSGDSEFGSSIAIGDFNNDGFNDLVASRPLAGTSEWREAGKVFVIYGSDTYDSKEITVSSMTNTEGFSVISPAEKTFFGAHTEFVDFNDDGILDLLFGAQSYDGGLTNQGAAYVLYGQTSFQGGEYRMSVPSQIDFDYTTITARDEHSERFGRFTKNVGDVNNDGIADIIVTKGTTSIRDHYAHIIFGDSSHSNSTSADVLNGVKISNDISDAYLKPHTVGDMNGDGIGDFALSTIDSSSSQRGAIVYVFYGKVNWSGTYLLSSADIVINSDVFDGRFGQEIKVLGDINGDNLPELLISEHLYEEAGTEGRVHLLYGNTSFPKTLNLDSYLADSSKGLMITGSNILNSHAGFTLATGGDFNGDDIEDFVIDVPAAGRLVLLYGGQEFTSEIDLDTFTLDNNADGTKGLIISGLNTRNYLGTGTSEAQNGLSFGDFNNDGMDDIAVANPADEKVYVFFGSAQWQGLTPF